MPGSIESQSIRLKFIGGNNIKVPSERIPAGIYISINLDSNRRWKSAIGVLSLDQSVARGDTVTISSPRSRTLSVEIRASYEVGRPLGNGEAIGTLETSWDELQYGDEQFELSFPPVRGVRPSLTLKAAFDNRDGALSDPFTDCKIAQETDAGHARFAEYVILEMLSQLNDAVEHFQFVLDRCPVDHPDRAAALTNLAWARLRGYIQKDLQDIEITTSLFRKALAFRPQGHPNRAVSLYNLILALIWRYSKEPTAVYIKESAQLCCELLPLCPEGTYLSSIGVDSAADYVISAFNDDLPIDASDEGIHLRRVVLKLCTLGHKHRPRALDKLSWALRTRFTQRGSIDDIDECIQLGREAVSLCPVGHSGHDTYLNNLAFSLESRFDHQGKSHDLDEAISMHEEALRLSPVGHKFHNSSLDKLGGALRIRFNKRGDVDDIHRAISLHRKALTLFPPGHPRRDTTLVFLAAALKTRYNKFLVIGDLNEAIYLYRESLLVRPLDHPERHRNLYNLGSALCSRYTRSRKNKDVEEAIQLCQESLETLPSLHPDRCTSHAWLQRAYLSRYDIQHNSTDLSSAIEHFRLASIHPSRGFPERIVVAIDWACQAEVYQHESALEAYQMCLELFDNHVMTRSSIISRREAATAFRGAQSLPVDAASCAICCDNLRRAVELVEQGRGQQWSLASRLRTPLEDLKSASPQLAQTLTKLSRRLSDAHGSTGGADRAAADRAATNYRSLAGRWKTAVAEIRKLEGFSRFLLPPSYTELQAAARHGPVIILIASKYLCSAIIVPTSGEPHHVRFPHITLPHLEKLKDDFATAIRHAARMRPEEPRKKLRVLLRIVWDEIMLPIVSALPPPEPRRRPRIWLCPTAAFTSIPLHAANPFRMNADRSGKESCLEDLYICSYTPTLSALIRARQAMKTRATPSFAAIGQSEPGAGQGDVLPAVDSELELVRTLVPAMANPTTLSGNNATRAGALQALQENTWVHLACHGKQDLEQPYDSCFAMRDKPLTLLDIMEINIPHAEFAFLSACHTAIGDEVTPDEAIHLAAGLQFSGFKSVIGTLWGVSDTLAKYIVKAFYENMFEDLKDGGVMDCTKAAWALDRATHDVTTKVPLEQRMVFIHIGV